MKTGILCKASEFGKIIINTCLSKNISINTLKLEKLLIIMQGVMLSKYNQALFHEPVIYNNQAGFVIPRVDKDFVYGAVSFNEPETEYILLLDKQHEVMHEVLKKYGKYNTFELEELYPFKKLRNMIESNGKSVHVLPYYIKKHLNI